MGGAFKWPSLKEVMEYRQTVRELVTKVIETAPLELPVTHDHPWVSYSCTEPFYTITPVLTVYFISVCLSFNIIIIALLSTLIFL